VADRAYCWGLGIFGALGTGQTASSAVPLAVATSTLFADLSVGANVACALGTQGDVYCWGMNYGGLLGDPAIVPTSASPLQIQLPLGMTFAVRSDATSFGLGTFHGCGLTAATPRTVLCWGAGVTTGAIGDGLLANAFAPKPVSIGVAFQSLAVGAVNNCAITPYGAAYCWGLQVAGSLGISSIATGGIQSVPALMSTP
jgi:alpha-tubulin suppressor-like RCC1 family protein